MFSPTNAMIRALAYKTLAWEPLLRHRRRTRLRNMSVVLMYHEIADDHDEIEAWTVVKKSAFLRQVEYLRENFDVVSLGDAISTMAEDRDLDRPLAVITFDDGDAGNRRVLLPLVEALKIPVTIFVATRAVQDQVSYWFDRLINALQSDDPIHLDLSGLSLGHHAFNETRGARNWVRIEALLAALKRVPPAEREALTDGIIARVVPRRWRGSLIRPLRIDEVRELASCPWVTIGAHSHCHNILTQLAPEEMRNSIAISKQLLESWAGRAVDYFAYPNGDANTEVMSVVKSCGFKCGLTTLPRPWNRRDSAFALPRIAVGRYDVEEVFRLNLVGGIAAIV